MLAKTNGENTLTYGGVLVPFWLTQQQAAMVMISASNSVSSCMSKPLSALTTALQECNQKVFEMRRPVSG